MGQNLLKYVRWSEFETERKRVGGRFVYSGSAQFKGKRVAGGDTIWTVSIKPIPGSKKLSGDLYLCGRMLIDRVKHDRDFVKRRTRLDRLWKEDNEKVSYAIPAEGAAELYTEICIAHVAKDIRFKSRHDRLGVTDNRVDDAQQLRTLRRLDANTVARLEQLLSGGA